MDWGAICWKLAKQYPWASPEAVSKLTHAQLQIYLQEEEDRYVEPLKPKSNPYNLSPEDLVIFNQIQEEKRKQAKEQQT